VHGAGRYGLVYLAHRSVDIRSVVDSRRPGLGGTFRKTKNYQNRAGWPASHSVYIIATS
jgi:hypothetical protein